MWYGEVISENWTRTALAENAGCLLAVKSDGIVS